MAEIFRKLKALEFQWKIITPYFIRCRWVGQRAEWVVGGALNGSHDGWRGVGLQMGDGWRGVEL